MRDLASDSCETVFLHVLVLVLKAAKRSHIPGSVKTLIALCIRRRSLGCPLKRLSIVRSQRVTRADIEQLRQVVGRVHWDGVELNGKCAIFSPKNMLLKFESTSTDDVSHEPLIWHELDP